MDKLKIIIRRDKETKRPVLFFRNSFDGKFWIECYDRIGQHSEASREYMIHRCKPEPMPLADDAAALVKEWCSLPGEPTSVVIGKRL